MTKQALHESDIHWSDIRIINGIHRLARWNSKESRNDEENMSEGGKLGRLCRYVASVYIIIANELTE